MPEPPKESDDNGGDTQQPNMEKGNLLPDRTKVIISQEFEKYKNGHEPQLHRFRKINEPEPGDSNDWLYHMDHMSQQAYYYIPSFLCLEPATWKRIFNEMHKVRADITATKSYPLLQYIGVQDLHELVLQTSVSHRTLTAEESHQIDFGALIRCAETSIYPCTVWRITEDLKSYTRLRIGRVTVDMPEETRWGAKAPEIAADLGVDGKHALDIGTLGFIGKQKTGTTDYAMPFDTTHGFIEQIRNWNRTSKDVFIQRPLMVLLGKSTHKVIFKIFHEVMNGLKHIKTYKNYRLDDHPKTPEVRGYQPEEYHNLDASIYDVIRVPGTDGSLHVYSMKPHHKYVVTESLKCYADGIRGYAVKKQVEEEVQARTIAVRIALAFATYRELPDPEKQ